MKLPIFILYCFASVSLTGCGSLYKNYSRSDMNIDIDKLYSSDKPANDTTSSIVDLSWREMFTDTLLQNLITQGLKENTDLGIARLRVEEAEAMLLSSRLSYLPNVNIDFQGQSNKYENEKSSKAYRLAVTSDWELDIFGRITNAKKQAKAVLEQNWAYRQAVQTSLIATIANSYYNLLALDAQLAISKRTSEIWAETVRTLQLQKEVGETTEAAVTQAIADKLTVDASILTLQKRIRSIENSLSSLIGTTPQTIQRSVWNKQLFPNQLTVGVPLELLNRRPDVRQAEAKLKQMFYTTNIARAAFYPKITLSGLTGWTNQAGNSIINPGKWMLNVIGALTQPLFNRGANMANLKIAKAQEREAILSFRQSLLDAGTEVCDAMIQWQIADEQLKIDNEQIILLTKTVNSNKLLMEHSNMTTYLEVLTAQQSLLQAELQETEDWYEKVQGVINLYHAFGGGIN